LRIRHHAVDRVSIDWNASSILFTLVKT